MTDDLIASFGEWEDANRTRLLGFDGEHEIVQDPVYGYWTLKSHAVDCIAQHVDLAPLVAAAKEH